MYAELEIGLDDKVNGCGFGGGAIYGVRLQRGKLFLEGERRGPFGEVVFVVIVELDNDMDI